MDLEFKETHGDWYTIKQRNHSTKKKKKKNYNLCKLFLNILAVFKNVKVFSFSILPQSSNSLRLFSGLLGNIPMRPIVRGQN